MALQPGNPLDHPTSFGHHVGLSSKGRLWNHVTRQVLALEVEGPLSEAGEDLDWKIKLALAETPRGVVCDLSDMSEGPEAGAIELLASAGRHVRDWPGIPVAVACPDPRIREALGAHPLGRRLIVTDSRPAAVSGVLATPSLAVERLRLVPHPTAPHRSRNFVARVLQDWGLDQLVVCACLLVDEMVTSSTNLAGTDIDLGIGWNLGALRMTVRDHGPALVGQRPFGVVLPRRGLSAVTTLSRACGVLPTADGGRVVWSVINAAAPPTRPVGPKLTLHT